jgi:hypothetical protein
MTDGPSLNVTGGPAIDSLKNQNNNKKWNFKNVLYHTIPAAIMPPSPMW